jgi:hypothetical protein
VLFTACADWTSSNGELGLERYESWVQRNRTLTVVGLWANADVSLDLLLRLRGVHGTVDIRVNDGMETVRLREPKAQVVSVSGTADAEGVLRIALMPAEKRQGHVRIDSLHVRQKGAARIPATRWFLYLALLALGGTLGYYVGQGARGAGGGLLSTSAVVAAGVWGLRLQTLMFLPWASVLLIVTLLVAGVASLGLRMPRSSAVLVCLVLLFRTTAFLQAGFPAIDAGFHSENLQRFEAGEVILSAAPGPDRGGMAVPYPTVFYALLSPFSDFGWPTDRFLVRLAMAILEGSVPLLVYAIMRGAGASETASAYGAAVQAAMPEGVLVLGKGIAANITGGWTCLLTVLGIVRAMSPVTTTCLSTLTLLSHFGAGIGFLLFILLWAVYGMLRKGGSARDGLALLVPACLGLGLAWMLYYREVHDTTTAAANSIGRHLLSGDFFGVRWYRAGKFVQDLALKFGVTPLVLAWIGLRTKDAPDRLKALLAPWFVTGALTGLLALLSPLPLRFEYFLVPAVAMAAGLGSEHTSRRWRVVGVLVPLLLQIVLAGFLLARRFYLISVIIESPRWLFPFQLF